MKTSNKTRICINCSSTKAIEKFDSKKLGGKTYHRHTCRECLLPKKRVNHKSWRDLNPERIKEMHCRERAKNYAARLAYKRLYNQVNRAKVNEGNKKQRSLARSLLSDSYIKDCIQFGSSIPRGAIPIPLIQVKRAELQLRRHLKQKIQQHP